MFERLTDLEFKRSGKQAFGFYLAYFLLFIVIAFLVGAVFYNGQDQEGAVKIGTIWGMRVSSLGSLILGLLVFQKKGMLSFGKILLVVIAGILGYIGGALLGLIPVAWLTTQGQSHTPTTPTPSPTPDHTPTEGSQQ
jgi:hypothetical protein